LKEDRSTYRIIENLLYLSSLAQFNTERRQLILRYYDFSIRNRILSEKLVSSEDIKNFCLSHEENDLIENWLLTLPLDTSIAWNFEYTTQRYAHLENLFLREYGFHISPLTIMEVNLRNIIYSKANSERILDRAYKFKNKEEYGNLCFLSEPNKIFTKKWSSCVILSENEILEGYIHYLSNFDRFYMDISSIAWEVDSEGELIQLRLNEALKILNWLSVDLQSLELNYNQKLYFLHKPLLKVEDEDSEVYYIVPFPFILGSTMNIRIENSIQLSEKLKKVDEKKKGDIVEILVNRIFPRFFNKNIIKKFRYKIYNTTYESDIILLLDKSLWVVEVKSHPIFRRIPSNVDRIVPVFVRKVKEGLIQGKRTLEFLSKNKDLLFHLTDKNFENLVKGIIVVLDGFIPTLLTLNKEHDSIVGTDEIYRKIPNTVRVYVVTLLDLYILSMQPDKDSFEDFLLWRTDHLGNFPIISYGEKEYWSFYNDHYTKHEEIKNKFPKLVENGIKIAYVSARFNKKDYLEKEKIINNQKGN